MADQPLPRSPSPAAPDNPPAETQGTAHIARFDPAPASDRHPDASAGESRATENDDDLFEPPAVPGTRPGTGDDMPAPHASSPHGAARPRAGFSPPVVASPAPLYGAAIASAFWCGTLFAYAVGYYGPAGLLTLPPAAVAGLAAALFAPLAIVWGFALVLWWGGRMRATADALAEATRALITPSDAAVAASRSVGHAVSDEIRRMEAALAAAEARAADLRKGLAGELNGLEAASARAEMRARTLRDLIAAERTALAGVGEALEQESAAVVEATRAQAELVSDVTGRAAQQMTEAQAGLGRASEYLTRTLESVARSARAVRENVEAQADRLEAAGETAVAHAGDLAGTFTATGEQWDAAARRLADENERSVRAFAEQRETLDTLAETLSARAEKIDSLLAGHAATLGSALDAADAKAMGLAPRVTREAERLAAAARSAAAEIEKTAGLMDIRTDEMTARVGGAAGPLPPPLDDSSRRVDAAGDRLQPRLGQVGGTAREAASGVTAAADDLSKRMQGLPGDAQTQAERLRAVMTEQIGAIAAIAESVAEALDRMTPGPAAGTWPPVDPVLPSARDWPRDWPRGEPASPAGTGIASDAAPETASRRPRLGDILSAARARETGAGARAEGAPMPRAAHHIIETLQSLSIDIDRALAEDPPLDLWKRYRAGERRVFAKRLAGLKGREPHVRIAERYGTDAEFRADADRFMTQFEGLLASAAERDRDSLLAETYMSSDLGKVYWLLADATGRLAG